MGATVALTLTLAPTAKAQDIDLDELGIEPIDANGMRSYMKAHYEDILVHGGVSIGVGALGLAAGSYFLLRPSNPEQRKFAIPLFTFGASQIIVGSLLLSFPRSHAKAAGDLLTNDPARFISSERERADNLQALVGYGTLSAFAIVLTPAIAWMFSDEFKKTWQNTILMGMGELFATVILSWSLRDSLGDYKDNIFAFEIGRLLESPQNPQPMIARPIMFQRAFVF